MVPLRVNWRLQIRFFKDTRGSIRLSIILFCANGDHECRAVDTVEYGVKTRGYSILLFAGSNIWFPVSYRSRGRIFSSLRLEWSKVVLGQGLLYKCGILMMEYSARLTERHHLSQGVASQLLT